jgi:hypothetical protein
MPKRNDDLFERLRRAGIRKQVARTLSELSEDAGKKAVAAGRRAVAELRVLADEIEKRLPVAESVPEVPNRPALVTVARRRASSPATRTSARKASASTSARTAPASTSARTAPASTSAKTAPASTSAKKAPASRPRTTARPTAAASSPAPRGENKAKILAALKTGPRTASQVSQETGIATPTVSAALTRLSKAGEVTKATRGYALPS